MPVVRALRRAVAPLLALPLVAALAGCVIITGHDDDDRHDLDKHRRRWRSANVASYEYEIRRSCGECPAESTEPVRVVVRNRAITSMTYVRTGLPVPAHYYGLFPTVEGLFGIVEDAIDRDAAALSVDYDAAYAYPTFISIDYAVNVIDDEIGIQATGLVPR
jgi:hypothetical protein